MNKENKECIIFSGANGSKVKGYARIFMARDSTGKFVLLEELLLERTRIGPIELKAWGKVPGFIEARNLFVGMPKNYCGMLLAFKENTGRKEQWKLSVTEYINYEDKTIGLKGTQVENMGRVLNWKVNEDDVEIFKFNEIQMYFLNQVCGGTCSKGSIKCDTLNKHDMCFQSSKDGPDVIPVHFKTTVNHRRKREKLPDSLVSKCWKFTRRKVSKKDRERNLPVFLQKRNSFQYLTGTAIYFKGAVVTGTGQTIAYPSLIQKGVFHEIPCEVTKVIHERLIKGVTLEEYQHLLDNVSVSTTKYHCVNIEDHDNGIRIKCLNEHERFDEEKATVSCVGCPKRKIVLQVGEEAGETYFHKGKQLSFIIKDRKMHPYQLTWEDSINMRKCLGTSFKRTSKGSVGVNKYFGVRKGWQASDSPVCGPHESRDHHYKIGGWDNQLVTPFLTSMMNGLMNNAATFGSLCDPLMYLAALKDETQIGKHKKGSKTGILTMDFANVIHADKSDTHDKIFLALIQQKIAKAKQDLSKDDIPEAIHRKLDYAEEFLQEHGIGQATTCGYQYVTREDMCLDELRVVHFFLYDGAGIAVQLSNYSSHSFHGYSIDHRSAAPLFIKNKKVYAADVKAGFSVIAWATT